jgi:hypothetical protein
VFVLSFIFCISLKVMMWHLVSGCCKRGDLQGIRTIGALLFGIRYLGGINNENSYSLVIVKLNRFGHSLGVYFMHIFIS